MESLLFHPNLVVFTGSGLAHPSHSPRVFQKECKRNTHCLNIFLQTLINTSFKMPIIDNCNNLIVLHKDIII